MLHKPEASHWKGLPWMNRNVSTVFFSLVVVGRWHYESSDRVDEAWSLLTSLVKEIVWNSNFINSMIDCRMVVEGFETYPWLGMLVGIGFPDPWSVVGLSPRFSGNDYCRPQPTPSPQKWPPTLSTKLTPKPNPETKKNGPNGNPNGNPCLFFSGAKEAGFFGWGSLPRLVSTRLGVLGSVGVCNIFFRVSTVTQ